MCWISKKNKKGSMSSDALQGSRSPSSGELWIHLHPKTRNSLEILSAIYLWRLVLFCLVFLDISRQISLKIHKSQVSPILTRSGDKLKIQKSDKNIGLLILKIFNWKCYALTTCVYFQFSNFELSTRENYVDLFGKIHLTWDMPLTITKQINWLFFAHHRHCSLCLEL